MIDIKVLLYSQVDQILSVTYPGPLKEWLDFFLNNENVKILESTQNYFYFFFNFLVVYV